MNTQTMIATRMKPITSILMAGLLCAAPPYATGQVANGATFTRVTTGPIATDVARSWGCAWGDYDGDGFLDLMVGNGPGYANALYHNEGTGTFTRVTTGAIATTIGDTLGVTWGDYDNDGDIDLFAANWNLPSFLFRNDGNGNFTRVINATMGSNSAVSVGAAWGDYDDDGFLDLVVANGSGQNEYLYRNTGNGTFTQIMAGPVVTSGMSSALPLWSDYDNDGRPDLAISHFGLAANSRGLLFHNEGAGVFTRAPEPWTGVGESGSDWGDYDNDGDLDLIGTRWNNGIQPNIVIYRNDGDGTLSPITAATPENDALSTVIWGDYDNDGWLDFFCVTYGGQNDLLYHNNGDGTFTRITEGEIVNTPSGNCCGAGWGDYDNDGFLDLFVANGRNNAAEVNFLYHNDGNSNRWLQVSCMGAAANRSSIGARVRVQAVIGGVSRTLLREVTSGTGFSGSALRVLFGLGDATNVDVVRVEWPSGRVKEWRNVAVNQILALEEPLVASGATFTRVTTGPIATDAEHSFGCAWADYDGDGYLDLMVANGLGDANALYHNEGNGTFTRVTTGAIATTIGETGAVTWGDYDNDGDIDLFAANWQLPSFLFRNDGNGNFTRIINGTMGTNSAYSNGAAWGDYDDDGFLDLVVANSVGQNEYLYRNNGNGTFAQILTGPIPTSGMHSGFPLWSDYDNDGRLDLAISHAGFASISRSLLFHNEGAGEFTLVPGPWTGVGEGGTDWGDFDNDGDLDLIGTRWNNGVQPNIVIYRNDGAGALSSITAATLDYDEASPILPIWGDYDNDGWLDFFCVTHRSFGIPQKDLLFHNNGDGTFTRITVGEIVNSPSWSSGAGWGDYDNDGFLDLLVANGWENAAEVNFLYHNDGNSNRWLQVNCIGVAANRSSIGARVRVQAVIGGVSRTLLREVSSGSGYSGSALRVHFGLGDATNVDGVRVEWPSGRVKEWRNVAVNQILALEEPPVLRLEPVSPQQPGAFRFLLHGDAGLTVRVERSTNLRDWEDWQPVTLSAGPAELTDADVGAIPRRFYRAVYP